jgi:hypothetical protein
MGSVFMSEEERRVESRERLGFSLGSESIDPRRNSELGNGFPRSAEAGRLSSWVLSFF